MTGAAEDAAANPPLVHPGPRQTERRLAVPTAADPFAVYVPAGASLGRAVTEAFAAKNFAAGYVRLDGLACAPLRYVMPAPSPDADHLAWYSAAFEADGPARIEAGYMSVGRDGAAPFFHCHGVWTSDQGRGAGHLLVDDCVAAEAITLHARGFRHALFDRRPDPETNFTLFAAVAGGAGGDGALAVTLRPNEDLHAACRALCADRGVATARIEGLGSVNGATFEGGDRVETPITEFVIRHGRVGPDGAALDVALVTADGAIHEGHLVPGSAPVSVTAELVIINLDGDTHGG